MKITLTHTYIKRAAGYFVTDRKKKSNKMKIKKPKLWNSKQKPSVVYYNDVDAIITTTSFHFHSLVIDLWGK